MKYGRTSRLTGRVAAWVVVAASIAALGAAGLGAGWLSGLRARSSDAIVFPRGPVAPELVVVGVDARSVAEARQSWPWTRDTQADLIAKIAAAGARVVVLDIVLAPSGTGDDRLAEALASMPSVVGVGIEAEVEPARQWSPQGVLLAGNTIEPERAFAAVRDGSLPCVRIGRRILIPRRQLEALLDGTPPPA